MNVTGDQAPPVIDSLAENVGNLFADFLQGFRSEGDAADEAELVYVNRLDMILREEGSTLYVDFSHVRQFSAHLATAIRDHYSRVLPYLGRAVSRVSKQVSVERSSSGQEIKRIVIAFFNLPVVLTLRGINAGHVGRLVCFSGTVTRASEVRPELLLGSFRCGACRSTVSGVTQNNAYTEPSHCVNPQCANRRMWTLDVPGCVFIDWQKLRVQEHASAVPAGALPRSLDVVLRGEIVDVAKPGDVCQFVGTVLAIPVVSAGSLIGKTTAIRPQPGRPNAAPMGTIPSEGPGGVRGLMGLGVRELSYRMVFLACSVVRKEGSGFAHVGSGDDSLDPLQATDDLKLTDEEAATIRRMRTVPGGPYQHFTKSVCPAVAGHEEVKHGILLMLLGGVRKTTVEGIPLRGDVNVCVVGDPSTAKSNFLKYVADFFPRAIYTSGKASSASGLTASVAKDPETGQFGIEAGALMLADNGVCCIDEFDKMDLRDQVAIHEAMEQQTISIAKAGIQATLNARTSILAAANPVGGRYDRTKTLKANLNMTPPIMSRFDLFFIIVDEYDETTDQRIAEHIVKLHQRRDEALDNSLYSAADMQLYIRFARKIHPVLTTQAQRLLWQSYRNLRQKDAVGQSRSSYRVTVRQLESLIRLSEGLARLYLEEKVSVSHVREAVRLLRQSIIHVDTPSVDLEMEEEEIEATPVQHWPVQDDGDDSVVRTPGSPPASGGADSMEEDGEDVGGTGEQAEAARTKKKRVTISLKYDEYKRIVAMLVSYLRRSENANGVYQRALIEWYLGQIEDAQTEVELLEASRRCRFVIQRMIEKDFVLVVLGGSAEQPDDRLLALNANYVEDIA